MAGCLRKCTVNGRSSGTALPKMAPLLAKHCACLKSAAGIAERASFFPEISRACECRDLLPEGSKERTHCHLLPLESTFEDDLTRTCFCDSNFGSDPLDNRTFITRYHTCRQQFWLKAALLPSTSFFSIDLRKFE